MTFIQPILWRQLKHRLHVKYMNGLSEELGLFNVIKLISCWCVYDLFTYWETVHIFICEVIINRKQTQRNFQKLANSVGVFYLCEDKRAVFLFWRVYFTVHLPVFVCAGVWGIYSNKYGSLSKCFFTLTVEKMH